MMAKGRHGSDLWRRKALAVAIACAFAAGQVQANGVGPTVVAGQAGFSSAGNSLVITNSPGAIINWQGFSIGASETTRFVQQSAASSILNRVIGPDPSIILGTLTSNGRVFLINPSGILFGQGARIDVAGLVASTLNLSNQDFLAGRLNFTPNPLAGRVENQGSITTPTGGSVYLVGANVANSGIISSPQGDVILAAGQSVKILDTSTPGVRVELTASDNAAVNLGRILAQSGQVGIYGAALRNAGIIDADQVVRDASGKIVLRAKQDVTLDAGSRLSASGEQGGTITVQAETGTTLVSGAIEAKGTGAVAGTGGTVQLLGNRVGLVAARVDASGTAGGGTVLVGGDYQGTNPSVQNATATFMSADSIIAADAITNGRGGKVVLWANDATRAYGAITARGGAQGGDGGLIETSGHWLDVAGSNVSASAARGKGGTWLLDPNDITIQLAGSNTNVTASPNFTSTNDTAIVTTGTIQTALAAGTSVTVTTGTGGTNAQSGNILVSDTISWDPSTASTLTLNAAGNVTVDAAITAITGSLVANAGGNVNVNAVTKATTGSLTFVAGNDVNINAAMTVTTGNMVLRADNDGTGPGVGGGTVAITCAANCLTITTGQLSIRFNPADYSTATTGSAITAYGSKLTGAGTLDAKAWVFAEGSNRPYNGTTTATVNSSFKDPSSTLPGGITLGSVTNPNFNTKDVGTNKLITFGSTFTDPVYALFAPFGAAVNTGTTSAAITKADLLVTGLTVANKVYNANTTAILGGTAAVAKLGTDDVTIGGTAGGTFALKDVGTRAVTVLGNTISGADIGNYTLIQQTGLSADITKADLLVTGLTVSDKIYNANTTAILGGAAAVAKLGSDDITIGGTASGTFALKDVGTRAVTVLGNTISGADIGNYTLIQQTGLSADITPATLTVNADAVSKVYGAFDPVLAYTTGAFQFGDSAASVLSGGLSRAAGENAGAYAIGQNTLASNANYTVVYTGNNLSITPAALNVVANPQTKPFGTSDPALSFIVAGLVNNPLLGIADTEAGVISGALARVPGETAASGPYAITQGSLATNSNYALGFTGSSFVIVGAATGPVFGFSVGQVIFAGVVNNQTYYRPGNFWHVSLNSGNADPGFDVMRGTSDANSRASRRMNSCDSVFGGGFCETWSFPQQRTRGDN